jgi:hypothetical protein
MKPDTKVPNLRKTATVRRFLVLAMVTLGLAGPAIAGQAADRVARLDPQLRTMASRGSLDGATVRVIVTTRPDATDRVAGKWSGQGRRVHGLFRALRGVSLSADVRDLEALAADPDVLSVSLDLPVASAGKSTTSSTKTAGTKTTSSKTSTSTTDFGIQSDATGNFTWLPSHLASTLGVYSLFVNGSLIRGSGVGVAVIDSGIAVTGDYYIAAFVDFVNGRTTGPYDDFGHGTHLAGLMASSGWKSSIAAWRRGCA